MVLQCLLAIDMVLQCPRTIYCLFSCVQTVSEIFAWFVISGNGGKFDYIFTRSLGALRLIKADKRAQKTSHTFISWIFGSSCNFLCLFYPLRLFELILLCYYFPQSRNHFWRNFPHHSSHLTPQSICKV